MEATLHFLCVLVSFFFFLLLLWTLLVTCIPLHQHMSQFLKYLETDFLCLGCMHFQRQRAGGWGKPEAFMWRRGIGTPGKAKEWLIKRTSVWRSNWKRWRPHGLLSLKHQINQGGWVGESSFHLLLQSWLWPRECDALLEVVWSTASTLSSLQDSCRCLLAHQSMHRKEGAC